MSHNVFQSSSQRAVLFVLCLSLAMVACSVNHSLPVPTPSAVTNSTPTVTVTPYISPEPTASATPIQPPDIGQIVYTCQIFKESLLNQICLIEPNGANMLRLTATDQADHFYPSLSPTGNSVLFSSNMAGPYELFEQYLSGGLVRLTEQGGNYAPAVSPDNTLIAYTHTDSVGAALWLVNRDGTRPRYLIGDAWDAAWSPDGAWILHASDRGGTIQLWRVKPDGTELTQVTDFAGLRGRNDWSSQGLLATYSGESWNREIITFNRSGDIRRQITEGGNNLAPSFSPDGEWIVYTSYVDNYLDDNGCEIYVQHIASATRYRLTDNSYCDWQPRWGPDGND